MTNEHDDDLSDLCEEGFTPGAAAIMFAIGALLFGGCLLVIAIALWAAS